MRPTHPLTALFLTLVLFLTTGCSKDVDRIVANERLLRGQEGLGETERAAHDADQDTYVGVGLRNFGNTLLVGEEGAFQAETFLRVLTWSVPESLPGLIVDSVYFSIPNDTTFLRGPSQIQIELADSVGSVTPLASATYELGTLSLNLGVARFDSLRSWAASPLLAPTFILRAPAGGGVAGFQAETGAFHVQYTFLVNNVRTDPVTVSSRATIDYYLHSPLSPAPTGSETALLMGGRYETAVAVRADVPPIPAGYSLNEAAWVLHLDGIEDALEDNGFVPDKTYLDVDVFRIGASWAESSTDTLGMGVGPAVPALRLHKMDPATDTTLVIPIPLAWMRGWAADSTTNHGILVAFTRWRELRTPATGSIFVSMGANISPAIRVRSRESGQAPQLRVSWTSPPPGRI